jgi:hypothetical protein
MNVRVFSANYLDVSKIVRTFAAHLWCYCNNMPLGYYMISISN